MAGVVDRPFTSRMLPLFLRFAGQAGAKLGPLLSRYGLPADAYTRAELPIPLRLLQRLPDELAALIEEPWLGLRLAESIPRGAYGLTEFATRNAATLREACVRMCLYNRLMHEHSIAEFDEAGATISLRIVGAPGCFGRHGNELVAAFVVRLLGELLPPTWAPAAAWFAHRRRSDLSGLVASLRTDRIEFGQRSVGLALHRRDLDLPLRGADPALLSFLDREGASKLDALGGDFLARVRGQIRAHARRGSPLEAVATGLLVTPRTLQRRLVEHRVSYQALVDDVRRDLSFGYLGQEGLAIAEVAYALGFEQPASFVRAFRRWTGTTPTQYRRYGGTASSSSSRRGDACDRAPR